MHRPAPPVSPASRRGRLSVSVLALVLVLTAVGVVPGAGAEGAEPPGFGLAQRSWAWPLASFRLDRAYAAPPHPYGAGHRGIDLATHAGAGIQAPAEGTVGFVGSVAGRGVLTIDHGDGLVTTLEPVESTLSAGAGVARGQEVATLSIGGHATASSLHFGVRLEGAYINPLALLGGVPRAVLLPCC